ncbi:aspartyl-phosphate phosphatase Spo0E family protein [Paenibacillus sp. NPDC057934]|uniref:aspartyl-phosphate phosphatase Spo0E family protein n=1 Tax=Paenibacillus sp. NPDC057934 TaxID=3346282 RepID=UPI0036DB9E8B
MSLYDASSRNIHRRDIREDELLITIESLRCQLLEVAEQHSLSDRAVVELSERLDGYILLAQNKMMENLRSRKAGNGPSVKNSRNSALRSQTALQ